MVFASVKPCAEDVPRRMQKTMEETFFDFMGRIEDVTTWDGFILSVPFFPCLEKNRKMTPSQLTHNVLGAKEALMVWT